MALFFENLITQTKTSIKKKKSKIKISLETLNLFSYKEFLALPRKKKLIN